MLICTVEDILGPGVIQLAQVPEVRVAQHNQAAQRIAFAEKFLAEKIADVMAKAAAEIEVLCQLSLHEVIVKFQAEQARGPEPRIHCVIVAAKVPEEHADRQLPVAPK